MESGDRVIVPDPVKLNPFGSRPGPHGTGEVIEERPPKHAGGMPMLTVKLDSGEEVRIGSAFVKDAQ